MSQILINDYLKQLDLLKKTSGSNRETIVREAFKDLLKRVTTVSVETVRITNEMSAFNTSMD
jgi:hypothetical protein